MNHQHFSNLIFEDAEDRSEEQELELRNHMETCDECQALSDAMLDFEAAVSRSDMIGPEAGFVNRWQSRLEAERLLLHRRQTVRTLVVVGAGFLLLAAAILLISSPTLPKPDQIFWSIVYQYLSLLTYVSSFRGLVAALLNTTPILSPVFVALFSLGLVSELVVLWVVFFRLITNFRRVTA
jgi:hypothetical protein